MKPSIKQTIFINVKNYQNSGFLDIQFFKQKFLKFLTA